MKFKGKTFYTGDVTKRPVWNTSLVKKHLTPVHSYKNQYGKHPVCLFKQSDVKSKEKQVWFVKALAKYKKRIGGKSLAQRKVISQKAIDTKRAKVVEFITQLCDDIDFGDDSYDQLLRDAVDHRNDWQAGRYSNYDDMDTNIDKETQFIKLPKNH